MGNYPSALHQRDHVLSVYERVLPASHPDRIDGMGSKVGTLRLVGRLVESLALFKAALELGRQVFEKDPDELLVLEGGMANTLSQLGMRKEAAEVYKRVIGAMELAPYFGPSHEATWSARVNLGIALVELGRFSEAVPLLRDSLAAYDGMGLGPEHPQFGVIPQHYGRALLGAGTAAAAVPILKRSIAFTERQFGLHHEFIIADLLNLAEALRQLGCGFDERLSHLDRAVAILDLSIGREKNRNEAGLAWALQKAAECCEEAGHLAEAESRWAKCVAACTKVNLGFQRLNQSQISRPLKFLPSNSVFGDNLVVFNVPNLTFRCLLFLDQAYGADDARLLRATVTSRLELARQKLIAPDPA